MTCSLRVQCTAAGMLAVVAILSALASCQVSDAADGVLLEWLVVTTGELRYGTPLLLMTLSAHVDA